MLMDYLFEMINPYSLNQQGQDKGQKYRTGVYSESSKHLNEVKTTLSAGKTRNK